MESGNISSSTTDLVQAFVDIRDRVLAHDPTAPTACAAFLEREDLPLPLRARGHMIHGVCLKNQVDYDGATAEYAAARKCLEQALTKESDSGGKVEEVSEVHEVHEAKERDVSPTLHADYEARILLHPTRDDLERLQLQLTSNEGVLYHSMLQFDKAAAKYHAVWEAPRLMLFPRGNTAMNMGILARKQWRHAEARAWYDRAEAAYLEEHDTEQSDTVSSTSVQESIMASFRAAHADFVDRVMELLVKEQHEKLAAYIRNVAEDSDIENALFAVEAHYPILVQQIRQRTDLPSADKERLIAALLHAYDMADLEVVQIRDMIRRDLDDEKHQAARLPWTLTANRMQAALDLEDFVTAEAELKKLELHPKTPDMITTVQRALLMWQQTGNIKKAWFQVQSKVSDIVEAWPSFEHVLETMRALFFFECEQNVDLAQSHIRGVLKKFTKTHPAVWTLKLLPPDVAMYAHVYAVIHGCTGAAKDDSFLIPYGPWKYAGDGAQHFREMCSDLV